MNRSLSMNSSWWRQEGDAVDEQSHVEAGGGRRWMNSSSWRLGGRGSTVEMNSIPWSSVLRYATPLPMNRIPFRMWSVEHKAVSSVMRYARPRFHRLFHPSPPDEHDDAFHSDPVGWLPMNTTTTLFLCSDPAIYTSLGRMY